MFIITQIGMSALHQAVGTGCTDVVVELVKNGANLNLQNKVCHYIQLHILQLHVIHNTYQVVG